MEIEIRAFINNIEDFKKKIQEIGGKFDSEKHIIDYWFCPKDNTCFEQAQQHKPGSYALRIRKKLKNGQEIVEFNCKVLEKEGDHNAFHEHETTVGSFEQTRQILEKMGFKVFCIIDKNRTTYKLDHCKINIEDIKGFKPAVELEIISDSEIEKHRSYLKDLLNRLGIEEKDKIEKSITFVYMEQFSFKNLNC